MQTVLYILVAVMGVSSIGIMFMAMVEFVMYLRQTRKQEQPTVMMMAPPAPVQEEKPVTVAAPVEEQPAPVAEEPVPAVVEEPETVATEPVAEEEEDPNNVSFGVSGTHRLTLKEAYDALNKTDKGRYDKVVAAAQELELARTIESTYAYTVMQGRDTIARLRILRGVVTLDCTVINPDLVKYNKENGKKIRSRPTRFRIKDKEELDAAIYTMRVANQTSLDNRNVKKKSDGKES